VRSLDIDLRDVTFTDLIPFDAVIHLAALSDDAACDLDPGLTAEINYDATMHLARCCQQAGVGRFLFASSCSVYGAAAERMCDETSPVEPLTAYAASKLECERNLASCADHAFVPVFLRNATAYGVSPRLRLDLLLNDLVASALTTQTITMHTNGRAWRPMMHVEDIARAYLAVLAAPDELVAGQIFNVVRTNENYRVIDVADAVAEVFPRAARRRVADVSDRRSYRATASKLAVAFPGLRMSWTVNLGIRQLCNAMTHAGTTVGDYRSDRYRRVLRLRSLRDAGVLDRALRRREAALLAVP
ncbi:MAG: SDR family oxidoreductase, partial [Phycisphaerae bacterium]